MRSCDTVLLNFQNYLLGSAVKFSFKPAEMAPEEKSRNALKIIKWVIEDMLEWTPEEARDHFGEREIKMFKLQNILKKVIYSENINKKDYQYLISLIYPDKIKYDPTEGIIKKWHYIRNHEGKRFSSNTFDDEGGKERAYTLLMEFNREFIPASSIQDLYKAYSNSGDINNKLREAKLFTSLSNLYTYPITLLHEMIKNRLPGQEDNYLYAVYLYKNVEENIHIKDNAG